MSDAMPDSPAYAFETGASALAGSVQTLVLTPQPSRSTPPTTPSDRTKIKGPIHTDSQSSPTGFADCAVVFILASRSSTGSRPHVRLARPGLPFLRGAPDRPGPGRRG